jgi:hypothetical protein
MGGLGTHGCGLSSLDLGLRLGNGRGQFWQIGIGGAASLQARKLGIHIGKLAPRTVLTIRVVARGLLEPSALGGEFGNCAGQLGETLL